MMEKKRIDRLLAALSALALAAAAGLCLLLRLPQADSTAGRTALHFRGGEAYTLVVLSDGETPASRLAPLVRAAKNGGGSASLFFLEEPDAGAQALETVSGAEVPVLLSPAAVPGIPPLSCRQRRRWPARCCSPRPERARLCAGTPPFR